MTLRIRPTVGLLVVDTSSPYQTAVSSALAAVCDARDVNLVIFSDVYLTREGGPDACRLFAANLAGPKNIDGLIVPSLGNLTSVEETTAYINRFRPLPICTVSMQLEGFPNVQIDNIVGFRAVVRHLVEIHQRRHFTFLARPHEHVEGRVRRRAYAEMLEGYGITPMPDIVVGGDVALDPDLIRAGLNALPEIDAIVAVDDYLVPSLMQVLDERKIRVPDELAVTGFDDSDVARGAQPPLTSVRQNFYAMLDAALSVVLDQANGKAVAAETLVAPELVPRRSCGCPYDLVEEPLIDGTQVGYQINHRERIRNEREPILAVWQRMQGLRLRPSSWEQAFFDAFESDLVSGSNGVSVHLNALLRQDFEQGGEMSIWHSVISSLRNSILPIVFGHPQLYARAETLFQQLRIQVGRADAGRAHAQRIHAEILARQQAIVADSLLRHLDVDHLLSSLPDLFLQLGVRTFWFSTYPCMDAPHNGAKLAAAMLHGQRVCHTADTEPFPPAELVPRLQMSGNERFTWVVQPVHDEHRQLGLLVCSYSRGHGALYDIMALQIGAALQGALLIQRIAVETERRERAERERLERELLLAQRIQTSILPKDLNVKGLEIAVAMVPATEVGGDYYDVLPLPGGCFIGIGDVAGHGMDSGLVMMMLQCAVSSAVALSPDIRPRQALQAANHVLYDNIRNRLLQDHHATLTLLRYETNGEVTFSGAHEDMFLFRARTGRVEVVEVTGVWTGILADVTPMTPEEHLKLELGDVLLLYTDGSTEAANAHGELFGRQRLIDELTLVGHESTDVIRDRLLAAVQRWLHDQQDDIAFVVLRYVG